MSGTIILSFWHPDANFLVHRESVHIDLSKIKAGSQLSYFGIVNWQNEWWLSGNYMQWPESNNMNLDKLRVDPRYASFYGWDEKQQQHIREMTQEMEEAFLSYFGKRLVFFKNDRALAEAMQDHNNWWNEHKTKNRKPSESASHYEELFKERSSGFDEMDLGEGRIAAFFAPGEGCDYIRCDS